jgi:hypothetical protein
LKLAMTLLAFSGVAIDLASPWLILYISPHFALVMLLGDILMVGTFLVMAGVPLYEMWFLQKRLMAAEKSGE